MLSGKEYFYEYFRQSIINISRENVVLDIGTSHKFRKELAPFRQYFQKNYLALDFKPRLTFQKDNVDINASIYQLPFRSNSIDAILCLSVFEHLCDPFTAAREIHTVLRPCGMVFLTVPFMLSEHAKDDDYGDYFRYTEQAIKYIFRDFSYIEIQPEGGPIYFRVSLFPLLRRAMQNSIAMKCIKYLDGKSRGKTTVGWMVNLKK